MPKLRALSSVEIVTILKGFGFEVYKQKGSHIKLVRTTSFQKEILTIPDSKELPKGTTKAIYNQACRYVSQEELREYFYTDS